MGRLLKRSIRLHHIIPDQDKIWQDCSSNKCASIDGVGFLIRHQTLKMAAMMRSCPIACRARVMSLVHYIHYSFTVLQFLIHSTFVLALYNQPNYLELLQIRPGTRWKTSEDCYNRFHKRTHCRHKNKQTNKQTAERK